MNYNTNNIIYDKSYPLSNYEILKIINTNIITYNDLEFVFDIDNVMINNSVIILYNVNKNYGHWCCVVKDNKRYSFFDSYGEFIDEQKKHIKDKKNISNINYIKKLLLDKAKKGYTIDYNDFQFQKLSDNIKTCGWWCILRILYKHLINDDFILLIKNIKKQFKKLTFDDLCVIIVYIINNF